MVSKSEIERLRYEDRRETERWREHNLRAREKRGIQIGKIQLFERLLAQPETPAERLGQMSLEELDRLTAELERRFQAGRGGV